MVRISPRETGDDIYEQYTIKKTYELATDVSAVKGNLYTFGAGGRLVNLQSSSNLVTLASGVVQATAKVASKTLVTGEAQPTIQCHVGGSWVILKAAAADMTPQMRVVVSATGSTVKPQHVAQLGTTTAFAYVLGTIHEILAFDSNEKQKQVTAIDDLVVVQMGVS